MKEDKSYGEIRHDVKVDYIKKKYFDQLEPKTEHIKNSVTWLKCPEEIPLWLDKMFKGKNYKDRMEALKKLNDDSMNCRVENN